MQPYSEMPGDTINSEHEPADEPNAAPVES